MCLVMLEFMSTNGWHDESYKKIMQEMNDFFCKILEHESELSFLGTNNHFYLLIERMLAPFIGRRFFGLPANYLLSSLRRYLIRHKKILTVNGTVVYTKDVMLKAIFPHRNRHLEYPWAIIHSNLDKGLKILDIGSGVSTFPIYLSSKGHEVYSIDTDEVSMNRLAPKFAEWCGVDTKYRVGDASSLEFSDNTFDRIFCISVFEHLEEERINHRIVNNHKRNLDVKAIKEMLRVLKPGGLIILTTDWKVRDDDLRSYDLHDLEERVLRPFQLNLVDTKGIKPKNDDEFKKNYIDVWKSYKYEIPSFIHNKGEPIVGAIGVILKK